MLNPGRELTALVGFFRRFRSAYPDLKFEGTVSYSALDGESYSESFIIDLNATIASAYRVTKDIEDVADHLKEIAKTLDHIATGYRKPLIRIISQREHLANEQAEYEAALKEMESRSEASPPPPPSATT
jgi:hypothetical protein